MKYSLYIIIILLFAGCSSNPYLFYFDEVIYYNIAESDETSEDSISTLKGDAKEFEDDIIYGDLPYSLQDTAFVSRLESIGFHKQKVDTLKYNEIREIFRSGSSFLSSDTKCEPIFRDILVFKKKSRIVGIAKICFECGQSQMVGANADVSEFDQSADFGELKNVLATTMNK